jgi:hypothetical protein
VSRVFDNPAEFIADNYSALRIVVFVVAPHPIRQIVASRAMRAASYSSREKILAAFMLSSCVRSGLIENVDIN